MTTNQLGYMQYLETERANRAREAVQDREAAVREETLAIEQAKLPVELRQKQADTDLKYSSAIQNAEKAGAHTYAGMVYEDALANKYPDLSQDEHDVIMATTGLKAAMQYLGDIAPAAVKVLTGLFG